MSPAPTNFTDIAVASNLRSALCYGYLPTLNTNISGTFNPSTGDYYDTWTRAAQSEWMVQTFGPGFGFPVSEIAGTGGYTPDLLNNNYAPARQHGSVYIPPAAMIALGLPSTYMLTSKDRILLAYIPALYDKVVNVTLTATGGAAVAVPVSSSTTMHNLASDINAALARAVTAGMK